MLGRVILFALKMSFPDRTGIRILQTRCNAQKQGILLSASFSLYWMVQRIRYAFEPIERDWPLKANISLHRTAINAKGNQPSLYFSSSVCSRRDNSHLLIYQVSWYENPACCGVLGSNLFYDLIALHLDVHWLFRHRVFYDTLIMYLSISCFLLKAR